MYLPPLELVALPLQPHQQFLQIMAAGQQPVDGGAQLRLIADAGPLRLMLDVAFASVLAGNDDGQAVLLAEPV